MEISLPGGKLHTLQPWIGLKCTPKMVKLELDNLYGLYNLVYICICNHPTTEQITTWSYSWDSAPQKAARYACVPPQDPVSSGCHCPVLHEGCIPLATPSDVYFWLPL